VEPAESRGATKPTKDAAELIRLGRDKRRRGDHAAARQYFEAAAAIAPQNHIAAIEFAASLRHLHRLDEAEARYRAVLENRPDHPLCLEGLGDVASDKGEPAKALEWFEAAAASRGSRLSVQLKLGRLLKQLGRLDAAAACFRAALERVPEHASALIALGEIARFQGDRATALGFFQAAERSEARRPRLRIQIADLLRELHHFDEAESAYRSVLDASAGDVRALVGLGNLHRDRGDNAAALAFFEAAVAKAPEHRDAWFHLVRALRELCRIDEANAVLGRLGELAGNDDCELQVRRFEHFCLSLQLEQAETLLRGWTGHRDVPARAVVMTAQLYAALEKWPEVLSFFRERVVEGGWTENYDGLIEPLVRAARATGRYAEACELLQCLLDASQSVVLRVAYDQVVEETRLLQLLDSRWAPAEGSVAASIADPFRADRTELLRRVLRARPPGKPKSCPVRLAAAPKENATFAPLAEIFTCTDASYLVGASVSLFSLLKYNRGRLPRCRFRVYCAEEVLDLASAAFCDIGTAFATPIEVRPAGSLFPDELRLRTGWGVFTPGRRLSRAAYYRIYAALQLIDESSADRALYIDADTCLYAGVDRLLAFELAGRPLAVRLDEDNNPNIARAVIRLGLERGRYFNSGVLVLDLRHPELRAGLVRSAEIALLEQHRLTFVDQCALNLAFRGKFATLPDRFNYFVKPDTLIEDLPGAATIVHFLASPKPWDPMYGTPNCMPWLAEFAAMAEVVAPELPRRLLALQYPAVAGTAARPAAPAADER
jgi:lipopolysaccharide biosynthesis glycosyltransferase/Tfp pilus assembly protein PilF